MTLAICIVAALLLAGVFIRQRIPILRRLFIPASVISGFLGLALVICVQQFADSTTWVRQSTETICGTLSGWPGPLIAVVFATMMLQPPASTKIKVSRGRTARRVARQGLMVWIIVLGETAVGLLAAWLLIKPRYEVPNSIGMLIETGFAGGHGTAAAMGQVFNSPEVGLSAGEGLGMLMATCGLVFGLISGIGWINIASRLGWVRSHDQDFADQLDVTELKAIGHERIPPGTLDPLLLQLVWISLAFGAGMLMQSSVLSTAEWIDGRLGFGQVVDETLEANVAGTAEDRSTKGELQFIAVENAADAELSKRLTIRRVVDFPLFIYTLFGGFFVRKVLNGFGQERRIDPVTISRVSGSSMEVLVVAAITSLQLSLVTQYGGPLLILFLVGAIWTSVCLMVLSKRILPREHWFELGLINYGMSTGTTATGFVLLRMVDPSLRTAAASDYALAAQLSAPFIGGGMITIALPLLVLERVPLFISASVVSLLVVCLIGFGIWLRRGDSGGDVAVSQATESS
ncbi:MAG: sodium/glutamate symporter [Planctomycetota bacterium]